jgi:hypothetical protein
LIYVNKKKCTGIVIKTMDPKIIGAFGLLCLCSISSSIAASMGGGAGDDAAAGGAGAGAAGAGAAGAGATEDAEETIPNVLSDPVGTPIQCTANDVGSGVNAAVYRYMGGDKLRWYPDPPIASSWDPDWSTTFKKIDCAGLTAGELMPYNVTVGEPVQCTANDVGSGVNAAVYRVEENGVLRWYPNPPIASSWDPDWSTTFKKINCAGLTAGDQLAAKP